VAPQLMRHFSDHPEDLQRLSRLAPRELLREMGKLEATIEKPASAPAPPAAPPKTVTDAPAPPPTLGSRPAVPNDDAEGAVARGDFKAYEEAANRREVGALGK
jgi:hypothetical protein